MKRKRRRPPERIETVTITVRNGWYSKENNRPVNVAEIFASSFFTVDEDASTVPFAIMNQEDYTNFFGKVRLRRKLEFFGMAQAVLADGPTGQNYLDGIEQKIDTFAQAGRSFANLGFPDVTDPTPTGESINIPLVCCMADFTSPNAVAPSQILASSNVHEEGWNDLPPIPLRTLQQTLDTFLCYLLQDTFINQNPEAGIVFTGDMNWLPSDGNLEKIIEEV